MLCVYMFVFTISLSIQGYRIHCLRRWHLDGKRRLDAPEHDGGNHLRPENRQSPASLLGLRGGNRPLHRHGFCSHVGLRIGVIPHHQPVVRRAPQAFPRQRHPPHSRVSHVGRPPYSSPHPILRNYPDIRSLSARYTNSSPSGRRPSQGKAPGRDVLGHEGS